MADTPPVARSKRDRRPRPARYGPAALLWKALGVLVIVAAAIIAPRFAPAEADGLKLLAFGDSLTAGFGLPADQGFVPKLQAALAAAGHPVQVINAGVSGDTTAGGRQRLAWALSAKPDAAILELGANDGLRGLDPDQVAQNLDAMLAMFQQHHVPVLLAGMLAPRNYGADYAQRFDAVFPALAAKYHMPLYPFFLDGVATDPALNQADGLHPNAKGVDMIVQRILPSVLQLLAGAQS